MHLQIYHNPRCSKSRHTLELLKSRGHDPEIIDYLKSPPAADTLDSILSALDMDPITIMRTGEEAFKANREAVTAMDRQAQLNWLSNHIQVLQRPIVVNGHQARIGRPPETVLAILD